MPDRTSADVVDNPGRHRFELALDGEDIAAAYYRHNENGHIVLNHTEVPSEYGGLGLASTLARGVFDMAREGGDKLVLECLFMAHGLPSIPTMRMSWRAEKSARSSANGSFRAQPQVAGDGAFGRTIAVCKR